MSIYVFVLFDIWNDWFKENDYTYVNMWFINKYRTQIKKTPI